MSNLEETAIRKAVLQTLSENAITGSVIKELVREIVEEKVELVIKQLVTQNDNFTSTVEKAVWKELTPIIERNVRQTMSNINITVTMKN